jgi:hypothetical protein
MIARWKGIVEEIHFGGSIMPLAIIEKLDPEKPSFRPSKWPRKLKLLKIVNCQNCQKIVLSQLEKVGGHRYPPGSLIISFFTMHIGKFMAWKMNYPRLVSCWLLVNGIFEKIRRDNPLNLIIHFFFEMFFWWRIVLFLLVFSSPYMVFIL